MPDDAYIDVVTVAGKQTYQLTELGVKTLARCARIGMTQAEIADLLGVSHSWVARQVATDEAIGKLVRSSASSGALDLRAAMHEQAVAGDPAMLKFLGERRLKMRVEIEHTHQHNVRVIGAQPDYKLSAEDWAKSYAPAGIIDAEYQALPAPDDDAAETIDAGSNDGQCGAPDGVPEKAAGAGD